MRRIHLFEFEDQSWFPDVLRKGITDYLEYASNRAGIYKPAMPVIRKGLEKSGSNNIIDICSGGGGGISGIYKELNPGNGTKVILTDKYPNLAAFQKREKESGGGITYMSAPVDAVSVPEDLKGFRTQFVSFHHFAPDQAERILKNAATSGAAIGVFEATERSFINFMAMLLTPLAVMLAVPFIRPFSFSRLFFTYIIPAIPFFTMWDGLVSVMRTYSIREMQEMTDTIKAENYRWETGRIRSGRGPVILYLLGYPEYRQAAAA